jgi:YgiT-type zinc finger domain-containing protein
MEPCMRCHGELITGKTTQHYDHNDSLLIIRDIPAMVCNQCGEAWFNNDVIAILEKITSDFKKSRRGINITWYKDVA